MGIAVVQTAIAGTGIGGASSVSCSWPASTGAGNGLVMVFAIGGGNLETPTTPTDWTLIATQSNSVNVQVGMYYIQNAGSRSGAETLNYSPGALGILALLEGSGLFTSNLLEGFNTSIGSSTNPSTGSFTTSDEDTLFVGVTGVFNSSIFTGQNSPTNGFTLAQEVQVGGLSILDCALLYRIVVAQGSYGTTTAINSTLPWAGAIAALDASAPPLLPDTNIQPYTVRPIMIGY